MVNRQPTPSAIAVTPADAALSNIFDGFMATLVTGNVTVVTDLGSTVVFTGVALNVPIYVRVTSIKSTGTTATGIIGLTYKAT